MDKVEEELHLKDDKDRCVSFSEACTRGFLGKRCARAEANGPIKVWIRSTTMLQQLIVVTIHLILYGS